MEEQNQAKSKLKRLHDDNESEQRKNRRPASPAPEPEHTMKIIDLNDHCLVKIFGHLDLQSLFNVAVCNEWLRPAAREVYKRKFGKKKVDISIWKPWNVNQSGYITGTEFLALSDLHDTITSLGLKTCLQYLRCFGSCISNLEIDYELSESKYFKHVHQYVNDYCGENLIRIKFMAMPNNATEELQKVFVNVKEAEIDGNDLGHQWPSFVKCFPNFRRLNIEDVIVNNRLIGKPFEFLEHLYVNNVQSNEFAINQIVGDLLNGVHRLKTLRITLAVDYLSIDELFTMIKDCPSITEFAYSMDKTGLIPVMSADVQRIVAEHAALIEFRLENYLFTAHDAIALIRQLSSLNMVEFHMKPSECVDLMTRLISEWNTNDFNYFRYYYCDKPRRVTLKRKM